MKYILKNMKKYFLDNMSILILILISILAGVILSVVCLNFSTNDVKQELANNVYEVNNKFVTTEYSVDYVKIGINTIIDTGIFTLILLILGSSIIFPKLIYLLFVYKGYCLGTCFYINIFLMGNVKGTIYSLILFLVPYTVFVIFETILVILWNKFSTNILIDRQYFNIKKKLVFNVLITVFTYLLMNIMLIPSNIMSAFFIIKYIKII